jgi:hypothetical protein
MAIGVATDGVKWGSTHAKWAGATRPVAPINSGFAGQVGQESKLQPAVLEIGLARLLRSLSVTGADIF